MTTPRGTVRKRARETASTRVRSGGKGRRTAAGAYSIGRDDTNDIVVEDSSVSRCHAELRVDDNDLVLVDLESLNGTHIREDGRWIEIARASVKAGEPVLLGEVVITPDVLLSRIDPARRPSPRADRQALQSRTATGRPLDQRAAGQPGMSQSGGSDPLADASEKALAGIDASPAMPAHRLIQRPAESVAPEIETDRPSIRSNATAAGPKMARKRSRRVVAAAVMALLFVSGGIGVVAWVLAQPERAVLHHDATSAKAAAKR